MVAYFYRSDTAGLRPGLELICPLGLPLLSVALPKGCSPRRLERIARRLYRRGIRRCLAWDPALIPAALPSVDPLPLCRAKGGELALELLGEIPVWERRVALRGETAGTEARRVAEILCPRVGALMLDFDRGEEALGRHLRERYGAASLHLGQGASPQLTVELAPRPDRIGQTLGLWGEPELLGLTLAPPRPGPPELPPLAFLELLWETGRAELGRSGWSGGRNGLTDRRKIHIITEPRIRSSPGPSGLFHEKENKEGKVTGNHGEAV